MKVQPVGGSYEGHLLATELKELYDLVADKIENVSPVVLDIIDALKKLQ